MKKVILITILSAAGLLYVFFMIVFFVSYGSRYQSKIDTINNVPLTGTTTPGLAELIPCVQKNKIIQHQSESCCPGLIRYRNPNYRVNFDYCLSKAGYAHHNTFDRIKFVIDTTGWLQTAVHIVLFPFYFMFILMALATGSRLF